MNFKKAEHSEVIRAAGNTALELYPTLHQHTNFRDNLNGAISPYLIRLPQNVLAQAQACISAIYTYAHSPAYKAKLQEQLSKSPAQMEILKYAQKNHSVLMGYDFHVQLDGSGLALIEINTNSSGYLISQLLDHYWQLDTTNAINSLRNSFKEEAQLFGIQGSPRVAITDERIPEQKMYNEFLMYTDFFKEMGWQAELIEHAELNPQSWDMIYNRLTDFYLESSASARLLQAYLQTETCLTPSPQEYLLLADKARLIEFEKENLHPALGKIQLLADADLEAIWQNRKNLFFKPLRAFGARGAYRGASISRKVFERIAQEPYLAQAFSAPGIIEDWKFDLRFYVYKDIVQHSVARVYQGQVTGFNMPGAGFAPVEFV